MSSAGSLGGSSTGTTGGVKSALGSLDIGSLVKQFGQNLGQGAAQTTPNQPLPVQPGKMSQISPQQRLAMVMKQYAGG